MFNIDDMHNMIGKKQRSRQIEAGDNFRSGGMVDYCEDVLLCKKNKHF